MSAFCRRFRVIREERRKNSHTKLFVRNPIAISAQKNATLIARTAASRVEFFIMLIVVIKQTSNEDEQQH